MVTPLEFQWRDHSEGGRAAAWESPLFLELPSAPCWMQSPERARTPEQKESGSLEGDPEPDARHSGVDIPECWPTIPGAPNQG